MKRTLAAILLLSVAGCARFSTTQTDISTTNPYGEPSRTITTRASSYTLFSAKSDLAKFKAVQTDKSQSASVGSLGQESTGTNVVAALHEIGEILKSVK